MFNDLFNDSDMPLTLTTDHCDNDLFPWVGGGGTVYVCLVGFVFVVIVVLFLDHCDNDLFPCEALVL